MRTPARLGPDQPHPGRARGQQALGPAAVRALRERAGRGHRQPGHADGPRRPEGDLSVRLAGGGGRQHRRRHVSRTRALYPANAGAGAVPSASTAPSSAPTRSSMPRAASSATGSRPIVADAEAGFGGPLNAFEIMKAFIEAGAAGVHFEDQLASEKKCGHLGGKVLIPTAAHERNLIAARLAADVMGVPTLIVARTDAESAKLITSRRGRARPPVHRRRLAYAGRLLPPEGRHRPRPLHRARPCLRAVRRRVVVGDVAPEPGRSARVRRSHPRAVIPASCWPTTARRRSTGAPSWTRRPSPASSASWGPWATSSSS